MASTCPLTQNYAPKDCKESAGIVRYIVTPFANMLTSTVVANVVTAITKTLTWKTYAQNPEIADVKFTLSGDGKSGTYGYDFEANFQTYGIEILDQVELELLTKNKLVVIAEFTNGTYIMLGRDYGCNVVSDAFESGVAFNDFQGSKVSIKGRAKSKFLKVDSTIIAGLLA